MSSPLPVCPECASADAVFPMAELQTVPAVFGCDYCNLFFTPLGTASVANAPRVRQALIRRWDQLADDVARLVVDMRRAPPGVFDEEEHNDAVHELDETVWNVMVNSRPRLPLSRCPGFKGGRVSASRPSVRHVYLIVLEMRAANLCRTIQARDIHAEYERRRAEFVGESTVYHALTALRTLGVLVKDPEIGWMVAGNAKPPEAT